MTTQGPECHYTVYKITSPDGLIYVGCTGRTIKQRIHDNYHHNARLHSDIMKYGWDAFKIEPLCEKLTQEGAELLEYKFIEYCQCRNPEIGYNGFTGGARKGAKNAAHSILKTKLSHHEHRPVKCAETGVVYYGINEAEKMTGVCNRNISLTARGFRHTAGGFHWEYV